MKVLIIAGGLDTGGLENQIAQLAVRLRSKGHEVDLTCDTREADYKRFLENNGCSILYLPSTRQVGIQSFCRSLASIIRRKKYDVVHSNELFHSGIVMLVAKMCGVSKRIAHSHSTRDDALGNTVLRKLYHAIMRIMLLTCATDYISCSTMAGEYLFGKNAAKSSKWHLVFNAIDSSKFLHVLPVQLRKRDGWRYVVHVGRFVEVKNHDFIIEIARGMKSNGSRICFVLVGDGDLFEKIQNLVQEEALGDYVMFLGNRKDVPQILQWADAFILPSIFEGMPLSLIEAQAAGLPSVASSSITPEVDFGIGLVHWVSLEDAVEKWMEEIGRAAFEPHAPKATVWSAMQARGFDLDSYANKIETIYEN